MTDVGRSPIYPLNASAPSNPEAFFIPGLWGLVLPFKKTSRYLAEELQVTGLHFPHIVGESQELNTVEDYARYFRRHVSTPKDKEIYLVGYSTGGAIAFELANLLSDEGHKVGLIIFDTSLRSLQRKRNRVTYYLRDYRKRSGEFLQMLYAQLKGDHREVIRLSSISAMRAYRPRRGGVRTVLIRPQDRPQKSRYRRRFDLGWRKVTRMVTILETPGDHYTAFRGPHARPFSRTVLKAVRAIQDASKDDADQAVAKDAKIGQSGRLSPAQD